MAPSGRRRRTTTKSPTPAAKTTRRPRRTQYKKQQEKQPKKDVQKAATVEDLLPMSTTSSTTTSDDHAHDHQHRDGSSSNSSLGFDNQQGAVDHDPHISTNSSGCSTPKAKKFRIPKIETCPPAPKKKRVVSNCSLQRRPIAFFAHPDLELFFFYALRDISV